MKDFFKNVAATIVGLFAFGLIMTILGFICIRAHKSLPLKGIRG